MICQRCGEENRDNDYYCKKCGIKLDKNKNPQVKVEETQTEIKVVETENICNESDKIDEKEIKVEISEQPQTNTTSKQDQVNKDQNMESEPKSENPSSADNQIQAQPANIQEPSLNAGHHTKTCVYCGEKNPLSANFCNSCGRKLDNIKSVSSSNEAYIKRFSAYSLGKAVAITIAVISFIAFMVIITTARYGYQEMYAFLILLFGGLNAFIFMIPFRVLEEKTRQEMQFRNEMSEFKNEVCHYLKEMTKEEK